MRAPNGQGCSLWDERRASIAIAGDVLRNCVEQLEAAVKGQHQIEFRIHPDELLKLERMYPELDGAQAQFCRLLNEVMFARNMPYEFSHGDLGGTTTLMYIVGHREMVDAAVS